ncbi:MAG TPA: hypothetical protein VES66_08060 [Terriglobales bacterium]|nr:hypothetical protein [Terriglobales bacterium]
MKTMKGKPWEPRDWDQFERRCTFWQGKQVAQYYGVSPTTVNDAVHRQHGMGFKQFKQQRQAAAAFSRAEEALPRGSGSLDQQ